MKKKSVKKTKVIKKMSDEQFKREILSLGHFLKYNLYLLSKSIILSSLLQTLPKNQDGALNMSMAVNMSHGILTAFHQQDHPELAQEVQPASAPETSPPANN